jgi:uncharacterized protein YlxW (UPF0749 family)
MTLLNEVINRPLDAGYAEAAERRAAPGAPERSEASRWLAAAVAAVLGVATAAGVLALRAPAPEADQARVYLERDAAARQDQVERLTERNRELSSAVDSARSAALAPLGPSGERRADALAIASGATAVGGPGLVVSVDQDRQAIADGDPDAAIRGQDLQVIVGGLWQAGAEAVAVNGVRLTAKSPISEAGEAIYVDLNPVLPPYRISAIGDGEVMEIKLARTAAGTRIEVLRNRYGASIGVSVEDDLAVPASGGVGSLYYAGRPSPGPTGRGLDQGGPS